MNRSFYVPSLTALALLTLLWAGCDSSDPAEEEQQTDADVFVGDWELTGVSVNGLDVSALALGQVEEASAQFESNGTFSGIATREGESNEVTSSYELDEGSDGEGTVTFTGGPFETPVTLDYAIENNDEIVLESENEAFLTAFADTDLSGLGDINSVSLVLTREG